MCYYYCYCIYVPHAKHDEHEGTKSVFLRIDIDIFSPSKKVVHEQPGLTANSILRHQQKKLVELMAFLRV